MLHPCRKSSQFSVLRLTMGAGAAPNPQTKGEGLTGLPDAAIRSVSLSKGEDRRKVRDGIALLSQPLWEDSLCYLSRSDENRWK